MDYDFNLERIKRARFTLDAYFREVPKGKQPRDLWKDVISTVEHSGSRNKMYSKNLGIVDLSGTVEKAYKAIINYAKDNENKPPRERFMTLEDVAYWADWMKNEFEQYSSQKFSLLTYFDYIMGYYIVTSFRGFAAEYEFCNWLNKKMTDSVCYNDENITEEMCERLGCKNHDELDRKLMIDLLVDNDIAIQVKNKSFLLGGGYKTFEDDYNNLKKAAKELREKYHIDYNFVFYDPDGGWVRKRKDGLFIFSSNEIFNLFDNYSTEDRKRLIRKMFEKGNLFVSDLTV